MSNEADTCRKLVLPKLVDAGWDNEPHRINEQVTFTDGRITQCRYLQAQGLDLKPAYTITNLPYELIG